MPPPRKSALSAIMSRTTSFSEYEWFAFSEGIKRQLMDKVQGEDKDYILGVDPADYKQFLVSKFTMQPLEINRQSEIIAEPIVRPEEYKDYGSILKRNTYVFTVTYNFSGHAGLFNW
jgi:hypothetical protein